MFKTGTDKNGTSGKVLSSPVFTLLRKINNVKNELDNNDVKNQARQNDYNINEQDIATLRTIGRKSINDFTSEDIQKTEKWARKFYKELGTKSPFFRAWFGDWRAKDIKPAIATSILQKVELNKKSRTIKNEDTEWSIKINNSVFEDTLHYAGKEKPYLL